MRPAAQGSLLPLLCSRITAPAVPGSHWPSQPLVHKSSALCRVLVRFRPLSPAERPEQCVLLTSPSSVQHTSSDGSSLAFTFDGVHGQATSQEQMFAQMQDIVRAVLQGQNGSIIAYGQTGALL